MAPKGRPVQAIIRLKLAASLLPRLPSGRVWAGQGNGETCNGCDERITKDQNLYEWEVNGGVKIVMHLRCYEIWNELRQKTRSRRS